MVVPARRVVPNRWAEPAVKGYLIRYLIGGDLNSTSMEDFEFLERALQLFLPGWQKGGTRTRG